MSLITALNSALSGLQVTQAGINNASNNIASADNPNYSRKSLVVEVNTGGVGGARIAGFTRSADASLNKAYLASISESSKISTQKNYFDELKDITGLSNNTIQLSTKYDAFTTAFQNFSASPESALRQREVVRSADSFATALRSVSSEVEELDRRVVNEQSDNIDNLNRLLARAQTLNDQVASATARSQPTGDLEDTRDAVFRDIAKLVEVRQLPGDQGRIRLITPSGYSLLDVTATTFTYNSVNIQVNGVNVDNALTGGSIEALTKIRQDTSPASPSTDPGVEVLRKIRSQLETLAQSFLATAGSADTSFTQANATSMAADNTASTLTLGSNTWTGLGYTIGDQITLTGMSAGGNNTTFTITALSNGVATVTPAPTTQTADASFSATRGLATFASAYNAATAGSGELASGFFTGTNRLDITVNGNLLNGTSTVKRLSADPVVTALNNDKRDYTADGLTLNNATYSGYLSAFLGGISEGAIAITARGDIATASETSFKERLAGKVGVNTDEELVSLTRLQNSYAASARVISVVRELFATLEELLR